MSDQVKLYKVMRIFKHSLRKTLIKNHLTLEEAQALVKEDIRTNPKSEKSMLCYSAQN